MASVSRLAPQPPLTLEQYCILVATLPFLIRFFCRFADLLGQTLFFDGLVVLLLLAGLNDLRRRRKELGTYYICLSAGCFVWVFVNILVIYPATH